MQAAEPEVIAWQIGLFSVVSADSQAGRYRESLQLAQDDASSSMHPFTI